jgi:hypothetical protein
LAKESRSHLKNKRYCQPEALEGSSGFQIGFDLDLIKISLTEGGIFDMASRS